MVRQGPQTIRERPPEEFPVTNRPFEKLLHDAFSTLRVREVSRADFRLRGPSRDLEVLSRVLGRDSGARHRVWLLPG